MQKNVNIPPEIKDFTVITDVAPITVPAHGGRAKCLQRLTRLKMPVPRTVALSFETVRAIADGDMPDLAALLAEFDAAPLLTVRPSSEDPDWGGPGAILNIGMNAAQAEALASDIGQDAAQLLYLRFVQSFAVHVARLDPDAFDTTIADNDGTEHIEKALNTALEAYQFETDSPFPQDPAEQLHAVLRSMARAWQGTTARLLREAKGAPADAGLGLIVQQMALGLGHGESGSGVIQSVHEGSGERMIKGRYLGQSQGRDALKHRDQALYLQKDARGPSLEERCPEILEALQGYADLSRRKLREEMQLEFVVQNGSLFILDGVRLARSSLASVRIAVELAEDGIIPKEEAVLRIPPQMVSELLHRQIHPLAKRDLFGRGLAASPGAATGKITFSAARAQTMASKGEACVLVRRETTPEDIRGMHAAQAVLTQQGGLSSHAAVIGRGLGVPCIVGASHMEVNSRKRTLTAADGRVLHEGDEITLDGGAGEVFVGAVKLREAAIGGAYQTLLEWAGTFKDLKVRANADTPMDAQTARRFGADGIGLCRTEHMFFEGDRLTVMREMIFADTPEDRQSALAQLLPMQRDDFEKIFEIMDGMPVSIRLLDPPLHEFLPTEREGLRDLAEALDKPLSDVEQRVDALSEFNPMLGMRGVRLGITVPEIYDMQARAVFEAIVALAGRGHPVVPEIMIPLVSAKREVEIVKTRIDAIAAEISVRSGVPISYKLGVMVETPRAVLRAGDISQNAEFLSFGTNDLTQMTYGLSRDDAGRFMSSYVQANVFKEDPFQYLDEDAIGELLQIGADRSRAHRPDVVLSLCGEHGGNPQSIAFCRALGFDYVSCSPFRVPVARLAAAQLALKSKLS
ncbi:MAG: putative PEP-binding protein [Pseudomonadota bacterium]